MQHPWISTKESLPSFGQDVLGIYKSDISRYTFEPFPGEKQPFFRPGTMLPIKHIKWWMPMITEGWHKLAEKQPEEGQKALTMNRYGDVPDAIWKRFFTISELQFEPFVREVVYWIEMPALPPDVVFKY